MIDERNGYEDPRDGIGMRPFNEDNRKLHTKDGIIDRPVIHGCTGLNLPLGYKILTSDGVVMDPPVIKDRAGERTGESQYDSSCRGRRAQRAS